MFKPRNILSSVISVTLVGWIFDYFSYPLGILVCLIDCYLYFVVSSGWFREKSSSHESSCRPMAKEIVTVGCRENYTLSDRWSEYNVGPRKLYL